MKKALIIIVILIVIGGAYWLLSPLWRVVRIDEPVPSAPSEKDTTDPNEQAVMLRGVFVNGAHDVSGTAMIIDTGLEKVVRFEDFKTANGPDLYVYLATDASAKDHREVAQLKGTEGNINYPIPEGIDLTKYDTVLIWCKTFGVLFGSAELK